MTGFAVIAVAVAVCRESSKFVNNTDSLAEWFTRLKTYSWGPTSPGVECNFNRLHLSVYLTETAGLSSLLAGVKSLNHSELEVRDPNVM